MKQNPRIKVTTKQVSDLRKFAKYMDEYKKEWGCKNKKVDHQQTDLEVRVKGLIGELVVALHLGLKFHVEVHPEGDGGSDLNYKDSTIQVKFCSYPHGHLAFMDIDEFSTDFAALVTPTVAQKEHYEIKGFISKDRFKSLAQHKTLNMNMPPRWCVHYSKLKHIDFIDFAIEHFKGKGE